MPTIHRTAATNPARPKAPGPSRRTLVARPAKAPRAAPVAARPNSRTASLPAEGMPWRNWDATQTVITTGKIRRARVILWPRICNTTRPTRATFIRYSVIVMHLVSTSPGHTTSPHGLTPRLIPSPPPTQPLAGQLAQLPALKTTLDIQAQARSVPSIPANGTSCATGVGRSWDHLTGQPRP